MDEVVLRIDNLHKLIEEKIQSKDVNYFDRLVLILTLIVKIQLLQDSSISNKIFVSLMSISGCSFIHYNGFFPEIHNELRLIYSLCVHYNSGEYLADMETPHCTASEEWSDFLAKEVQLLI